MGKPFVKTEIDRTEEIKQLMDRFKNDRVLVGIPEEESTRDDEKSSEINNAAILAINEFGSPEQNIPPRPVMTLGLRKAQEDIASEFRRAAREAINYLLNGASFTTEAQLWERAAIIAVNAIKKEINSQEDIDPPSEATLAARRSAGFKGEKALLVTAQLRNAITYVMQTRKV